MWSSPHISTCVRAISTVVMCAISWLVTQDPIQTCITSVSEMHLVFEKDPEDLSVYLESICVIFATDG